jgi:hypothetical protein
MAESSAQGGGTNPYVNSGNSPSNGFLAMPEGSVDSGTAIGVLAPSEGSSGSTVPVSQSGGSGLSLFGAGWAYTEITPGGNYIIQWGTGVVLAFIPSGTIEPILFVGGTVSITLDPTNVDVTSTQSSGTSTLLIGISGGSSAQSSGSYQSYYTNGNNLFGNGPAGAQFVQCALPGIAKPGRPRPRAPVHPAPITRPPSNDTQSPDYNTAGRFPPAEWPPAGPKWTWDPSSGRYHKGPWWKKWDTTQGHRPHWDWEDKNGNKHTPRYDDPDDPANQPPPELHKIDPGPAGTAGIATLAILDILDDLWPIVFAF